MKTRCKDEKVGYAEMKIWRPKGEKEDYEENVT